MKKIPASIGLIEQVYEAILEAICDGTLLPADKITQELLAEKLGVSRQPILQAFQLLKLQGFIEETGKRGVCVSPLSPTRLIHLYQVRSILDSLAAREAAKKGLINDIELTKEGWEIIKKGREAVVLDDTQSMINADIEFHHYIYRISGNPMIKETVNVHWQHIRRAMAYILRYDIINYNKVWDEHEKIFLKIIEGEESSAAELAHLHAESAAVKLAETLTLMEVSPQKNIN